jgi:predicted transcriptional regulator
MGVASSHPGIHFRELQRIVRLANGSLQYHLDVLTRKGLLRKLKQGGYCRFFPYWFPEGGMNLAGIIHNLPTRGIAKFLLENPWSSQVEITDSLYMVKPSGDHGFAVSFFFDGSTAPRTARSFRGAGECL